MNSLSRDRNDTDRLQEAERVVRRLIDGDLEARGALEGRDDPIDRLVGQVNRLGTLLHLREVARRQVEGVMAQKIAALEETTRALERQKHETGRIETALRRNQAMFSALAKASPVGVFRTDIAGEYLDVNERWREIAGMSAAEAKGTGWLLGVHAEDRERVHAAWRTATGARASFRCEFRFRTLEGLLTWVVGQSVPEEDKQGAITGHVGTVTDVSELRRARERLRELNETLEQQVALRTEQLLQAQKLTAIGSLAGGVAHDFNNLMTVIQGHGELLREALPAGSAGREGLEELLSAAARGVALTTQLLAFSREQVSHPELHRAGELVAQVGELLRHLLPEHVELVLESGDDDGWIRVDGGQLRQALLNLGVNARDAMPEGGRLRLSTGPVVLRGGEGVAIRVSDDGVGIALEQAARIFEPFYTTKEVGRGSGLGLAVVYGIVQQHQGEIGVESRPGAGATFEIRLPRAAPPEGRPAEAGRPGATVLVVEDEDHVRNLLRRLLQRSGHQVIEAHDGAEALALVEEGLDRIDLVVTDVVMPRINGGELARRLLARRPDLRVLFISGYAADHLGQLDQFPGTCRFLRKPFSPAKLVREIDALLASR